WGLAPGVRRFGPLCRSGRRVNQLCGRPGSVEGDRRAVGGHRISCDEPVFAQCTAIRREVVLRHHGHPAAIDLEFEFLRGAFQSEIFPGHVRYAKITESSQSAATIAWIAGL